MYPCKKSGSRYSEDAKEIIKNVHGFCLKEKESGKLSIDLNKGLERVSTATGVSKSTIKRLLDKDKDSDASKEPAVIPRVENLRIDDFDKGVIRRTINTMYTHMKILPTLNNIRSTLKESIGYLGSREHLRRELKSLGFTYRRCKSNRNVLMERSDVVCHRIQYLRKVKQLREKGYNIVYTDETYVHTNHAVPKCWQNSEIGLNIPFSKGDRMIVLHAGSELGFVPGAELVFKAHTATGDYPNEMNQQNFMKWLTEKLIPNLHQKTALILDNAAYHNIQIDRCPTMATRKADIQAWLTRHNITFQSNMLKPELLELCKQHRKDPEYVVDQLLATHGHVALRLPPYHAELNAIELIWGSLKGYIARHNLSFKLGVVKDLIQQGLRSIGPAEWASCVAHVQSVEEKYWSIDIAADEQEECIIELDSDDDDSATDTASEGEDSS